MENKNTESNIQSGYDSNSSFQSSNQNYNNFLASKANDPKQPNLGGGLSNFATNNINLNNINLKNLNHATSKKNQTSFQTNIKQRTNSKDSLMATGRQLGSLAFFPQATNYKSNLSAANKILDSRPIKDPNFINSCLDKISSYYIVASLDEACNLKELSSPDSRKFLKVFTKFMNSLLPDYTVEVEKLDQDIPKILTHLRYPGNLNKNHLMNVGAPGAWPNMIALLAWMSDVGKFLDSFKEESEKYFRDAEDIQSKLRNENLKKFIQMVEKLVDLNFPEISENTVEDGKNEAMNDELKRVKGGEGEAKGKDTVLLGENLQNLNLEKNVDHDDNRDLNSASNLINELIKNANANKNTSSKSNLTFSNFAIHDNNNPTGNKNLIINPQQNDSFYDKIYTDSVVEACFTADELFAAIEAAKKEAETNYSLVHKFFRFAEWKFLKAAWVEYNKAKKIEVAWDEFNSSFTAIDKFYETNTKMLLKIENLISEGFAMLEKVEAECENLDAEYELSKTLIAKEEQEALLRAENIKKLSLHLEENRVKKLNVQNEVLILKDQNANLEDKVQKQSMTREEYDGIVSQIKKLEEEDNKRDKQIDEMRDKLRNSDEKRGKLASELQAQQERECSLYEKYGVDKAKTLDIANFIGTAEEIYKTEIDLIYDFMNSNSYRNNGNTNDNHTNNANSPDNNLNDEQVIKPKYKELLSVLESEVSTLIAYFEDLTEQQSCKNADLDQAMVKINGELMRLRDKAEQRLQERVRLEKSFSDLDTEISVLKDKAKKQNEISGDHIRAAEEKLKNAKIDNTRRKMNMDELAQQSVRVVALYEKKSDELMDRLEKAQAIYDDIVQKANETKKNNAKMLKIIIKQREKLNNHLLEEMERINNENSDEENDNEIEVLEAEN